MAKRLPSGATTGTSPPRWVKVSAIVASILLVVFVVLHLTGNQLGGHMPPGPHVHSSEASSP